MKVNSISSVNYGNLNNVNFSGRKKDNSQNSVTDVIRSKAAAVPVVVLLAANPATLNSAIPAQSLEGAKIAAVQSSEVSKADGATFTDFPAVQETQQSNNPQPGSNTCVLASKKYSNWGGFQKNEYIVYDTPASWRNGNGTVSNGRLFFTTTAKGTKYLDNVYIGDPKAKNVAPHDEAVPNKIVSIIHHHNSKDDFYSAIVNDDCYAIMQFGDIKDIKLVTGKKEIILSDKTAKEIMNLLKGKTPFVNNKLIDEKYNLHRPVISPFQETSTSNILWKETVLNKSYNYNEYNHSAYTVDSPEPEVFRNNADGTVLDHNNPKVEKDKKDPDSKFFRLW